MHACVCVFMTVGVCVWYVCEQICVCACVCVFMCVSVLYMRERESGKCCTIKNSNHVSITAKEETDNSSDRYSHT